DYLRGSRLVSHLMQGKQVAFEGGFFLPRVCPAHASLKWNRLNLIVLLHVHPGASEAVPLLANLNVDRHFAGGQAVMAHATLNCRRTSLDSISEVLHSRTRFCFLNSLTFPA